MYGPDAVVIVLDRAFGESVKRGATAGRAILAVLRPELELAVVVVGRPTLVDDDRAVELSSFGSDGRFRQSSTMLGLSLGG